MSKDILKNKKLLTQFTRQIFLAPDTPAVIRVVASDAAYMVLTQAILSLEYSNNLSFFRILSAVCIRQRVDWPSLYEKLNPAASALGLSTANSEQINYYQILGVTPRATESEIKKAYRRKAFATHPDTNSSPGQSNPAFANVQAAYQTLSNSKLRDVYNRSRRNFYNWYEIPLANDRTSALKQRLYHKRWFFYQVITLIILLSAVAIILDFLFP